MFRKMLLLGAVSALFAFALAGPNFTKDIAKSEIVVGWNSMAMYIAHKLGKKVMHILPRNFKDNILPIKNILYLEKK